MKNKPIKLDFILKFNSNISLEDRESISKKVNDKYNNVLCIFSDNDDIEVFKVE